MFFTKYIEVSNSEFDPNELEHKSWLIVVSLLSTSCEKYFSIPMSVKIAGGESDSELWLIAQDYETVKYATSILDHNIEEEPFVLAVELDGSTIKDRRVFLNQ